MPYRTTSEAVFRVSTSPQYGAMIGVDADEIGDGVNCDNGPVNVTFPLLLT